MPNVEKMSFEESMKELEHILHKMNDSEIGLDEQISLYEKGMKLHNFCQNYLAQARLKVEKLILQDGVITKQPLEASQK